MQEFGPLAGRVFGGGWAAAQHQRQQPAKCPRCDSTDTKFCYYNNYNLAQPRYYCKSCRRHWTKGGVLRNVVPVGGGCRKSKRGSSSSSSSSSKHPYQPSATDDPSDSHSDRLRIPVSVPSDLSKDDSAKTAAPLPVPTPPDPPFEFAGDGSSASRICRGPRRRRRQNRRGRKQRWQIRRSRRIQRREVVR